MFKPLFKLIYGLMRKKIEKDDEKNSSKFSTPSNIEISSYYLNDKEDYYNLIKVYKNKDFINVERPLIINIHGGGWALKKRIGYDPFYTRFATYGYDTVGFSYYSVIDKYDSKDIIRHIFNVLHYLYNNKEKLNISFKNVFLSGDSAGGQLALFIDSINRNEKLQQVFGVTPVNIDIKGLVLIHPVAFIDEATFLKGHYILSKHFVRPSFLKMMYGKKFEQNDEYIYSNPHKYLPMLNTYPPILIISSEADYTYKDNTKKLYDTLIKFNIDTDYYYEEDPKSRHVFNIAYIDEEIGIRCNTYIDNFLKKICEKDG